jgi:hypothetical protein
VAVLAPAINAATSSLPTAPRPPMRKLPLSLLSTQFTPNPAYSTRAAPPSLPSLSIFRIHSLLPLSTMHVLTSSCRCAHPCASYAARTVSSSTGHDLPSVLRRPPSSAPSVPAPLQRCRGYERHRLPSPAPEHRAMRRGPTYPLHTPPDVLRATSQAL